MTVKELIKILKGFPSEFPVFLCTDEAGRVAKPPRDAYIDLVHSERGEIIVDGENRRVPEGFVDALVINAQEREPEDDEDAGNSENLDVIA